jgi:hypothetical protein
MRFQTENSSVPFFPSDPVCPDPVPPRPKPQDLQVSQLGGRGCCR